MNSRSKSNIAYDVVNVFKRQEKYVGIDIKSIGTILRNKYRDGYYLTIDGPEFYREVRIVVHKLLNKKFLKKLIIEDGTYYCIGSFS